MHRTPHAGNELSWFARLAIGFRSLRNLPLRIRLLVSFSVTVGLMTALGLFALLKMSGLSNDTRTITEAWLPRLQHAAAMKLDVIGVRVAQFQFVASDKLADDGSVGVIDKSAQAESDINAHQASLDQHQKAYLALLSEKVEREAFTAFSESWSNYQSSGEIFMAMARDGQKDIAMSMLTEQAREEFEAANHALDQLMDTARKGADSAAKHSTENYRNTRRFTWIALLFAIMAGIAMAWTLIRQTMQQLGGDPAQVQHVVERIAAGDLSVAIAVLPGDHSSLLAVTQRMQGEIQRLASELQLIHAEHARGALTHRIDNRSFSGIYAELAEAVNTLAASHIEVSTQVVAVIQRYALGDFSLDMRRLPGEQAHITEAMDAVKRQLGAIKDETLRLADAAGQGEFSLRGDASQFQFAFRDIVEGLNRLMANAEQGLKGVDRVLAALATGDLTQCMEGDFQGMFARLQDNANTSLSQLSQIIGHIQQAADLIETASGEIAAGNLDLSSRTENQASNLEETAASVEELASTVKQNAANSHEAKTMTGNAGKVAGRGGQVVERVVETMGAIAHSSQRIVEIIGVIDGIAFQTNILALNAAVEAARAGEQGRGFAVVATEVRALAQRSASAAREIKTLITESVEKVSTGAELVDEAGRTMADIVSAVHQVDRIMTDIASASAEQSIGIAQVNEAITQIDSATQQNAALVEEAAAAARSLTEQARELKAAASRFTLPGNTAPP